MLGHIIATIIALVLSGVILQYLQRKANVVYWYAHQFLFRLEQGKVALYTHALTIQNLGGRAAESIEIAHTAKPDFFKLQPALAYHEETTPAGDHIIRIPTLGPKEVFTVEFMSYKQLPTFLYIRSKEGPANVIPIRAQQIFPTWFNALVVTLTIIGAGFIFFWLSRLLVFLYGLWQA